MAFHGTGLPESVRSLHPGVHSLSPKLGKHRLLLATGSKGGFDTQAITREDLWRVQRRQLSVRSHSRTPFRASLR